MYWGDAKALALWSLRSSPRQAAKQAFIDDLKGKYNTVEALNAAWGTRHETWEALSTTTGTPDPQAAGEDLLAFELQ